MSALPRVLVIDDDFGRVLKRSKGGVEILEIRIVRHFANEPSCKTSPETSPRNRLTNRLPKQCFLLVSGCRMDNWKQDIEGTLQAFRRGWEQWPRWAMILLDLHFKTGEVKPDGTPAGRAEDRNPHHYFGLTILEHLQKDASLRDIPVIILSAMERELSEKRFSKFASDFVHKSKITSLKLQELLLSSGLLPDDKIIGHSVALLKCLREARVRARHGNDNILVLGESGTGKELIAPYIHKHSKRIGEFVPLFTHGVPETLIDDRLCGHEQGAFFGARGKVPGAAERANRGTLFIDEFGDIPASIQLKLLRLLDKNTREIERLGSTEVRKLDLQVVLATNRLDLLDQGDFRADLLSRVKVSDPVLLPPLRERAEDIRLLVGYFLTKYEKEFKAESREVSDEAWQALLEHDWPDNIRGLEDVIERAVYKWPGFQVLMPEHLSLKAKLKGGSSGENAPVPSTKLRTSPSVRAASSADQQQAVPLDQIVSVLREYRPDMNDQDAWAGRLDELQEAYATLLSKLVKAALLAKRDYKGGIHHTPAMRLLKGDKLAAKGEASIAYSVIKNLLNHHPPALEKILADPMLAAIYQTACDKRSAKKSPNKHIKS